MILANSSEIASAIAPTLVAVGSIVGLFFARKKSREDTSVTSVAQAISAWKEIAENHKGNWFDCEERVLKQQAQITRLSQRVYSLERMIRNKERLDYIDPEGKDEEIEQTDQ